MAGIKVFWKNNHAWTAAQWVEFVCRV